MIGVLDRLSGGAGILRRKENAYLPGDDDVYVPARLIDQYGLRKGDAIDGEIGAPPGRGKLPPLKSVTSVNGMTPEEARSRPKFD